MTRSSLKEIFLFLVLVCFFSPQVFAKAVVMKFPSGTPALVPTQSGNLGAGNCLQADANGNVTDSGAGCGSGGSGSPGGSTNSSQYNAGAGNFGGVTLNSTATKKYLQQVSSGAPTFQQVSYADLASLSGSNKQVLFNDSSALGADAGLTYDKATALLTATNVALGSSGTFTAGNTDWDGAMTWTVHSTNASFHNALRVYDFNGVGVIGLYTGSGGVGGGITVEDYLQGSNLILTSLTANTAVYADSSKNIASSSTTDTELGYVHGVTSAIQTQINAKQASGNYITALTGDVTASGPGSATATLANIPTATPAAGSILHTNIAAPSTPASGKDAVYSDSTDLRLHDKNASGVIGTTVVADTGASNNFLTAISAAGAISKAQPSYSNLSGSGSTSITTVGTIGTGTWQGTAIGPTYGGTGQSTTATSARYLKGDGTNWGTSTGSASGTGACSANNWASTLNSDAAPTCTQPAFSSLSGSATTGQLPANQIIRSFGVTVDGGGSAITTGQKGYVQIPFACTITANTVILDQTGSIVFDVWKLAFSTSALPTVSNTITASAKPTVSSAKGSTDSTLTGWTTSVSAGDVIGFNVDSITTATRATLVLKCNAT